MPRKLTRMPISASILDNPRSERVRHIADLDSAKQREKSGRFLIEGPQSVREAVRWRPDLVQDIYVEMIEGLHGMRVASGSLQSIVDLSQDSTIYVHGATTEVMHRMSHNAQGIVAVGNAAALRVGAEQLGLTPSARIAAFWQVRDPGNAGTVIRTADAAGCAAVVFVDECVDHLNPKVIRATAGSLFHIPLLRMSADELFAWVGLGNMRTYAADIYGTKQQPPVELPQFLEQFPEQINEQTHATSGEQGVTLVLFGNEARGLPPELIEQTHGSVSIPMYGKAESLNLAGSAAVMLMALAMSSDVGRI